MHRCEYIIRSVELKTVAGGFVEVENGIIEIDETDIGMLVIAVKSLTHMLWEKPNITLFFTNNEPLVFEMEDPREFYNAVRDAMK